MDVKLLDRIKKLVNKADSAREIGSVAEAEAFLTKVGVLLEQHNLSMSDVDSHSIDGKGQNDIVESGFDDGIEFGRIQSDGVWERQLFTAIADYYMCTSLYRKYGKQEIDEKTGKARYIGLATIIGTAENVQATKFVFGYVRDLLRRMSRAAHVAKVDSLKELYSSDEMDAELAGSEIWNKLMESGGFDEAMLFDLSNRPITMSKKLGKYTVKSPESLHLIAYRESWIRSYLRGAVSSINRTLYDMEQARKSKQEIYGLVLANEAKIEAYKVEKHPDVKTVSQKETPIVRDAYRKGIVDGSEVKIATGVEAGSGGAKKLEGKV